MRAVAHYQRDVVTIPQGATAREAAVRMRAEEIGSLVVMDRRRPVGIVTDRDLLREVISAGRESERTRVGAVMSRPLLTVDASEPLERVVEVMSVNGIRRVPVLAGEKLAGIVTMDDVLASLSDELADLSEGIRRGFRAARVRRMFHQLGELAATAGDELRRLRDETRGTLSKRFEELRKRLP
ncbi:MAG: CBS domain-containing protein [Deltaproteobacteria bacterium]|nr:MAG: CBS domain-containing protein [Deltaproteobacteria bacterium]